MHGIAIDCFHSRNLLIKNLNNAQTTKTGYLLTEECFQFRCTNDGFLYSLKYHQIPLSASLGYYRHICIFNRQSRDSFQLRGTNNGLPIAVTMTLCNYKVTGPKIVLIIYNRQYVNRLIPTSRSQWQQSWGRIGEEKAADLRCSFIKKDWPAAFSSPFIINTLPSLRGGPTKQSIDILSIKKLYHLFYMTQRQYNVYASWSDYS